MRASLQTKVMLIRVHNPFEEIRQVTREERKKKRKISCLSVLVVYFLSFFLSFSSPSFVLLSLNVKIVDIGREERSMMIDNLHY